MSVETELLKREVDMKGIHGTLQMFLVRCISSHEEKLIQEEALDGQETENKTFKLHTRISNNADKTAA